MSSIARMDLFSDERLKLTFVAIDVRRKLKQNQSPTTFVLTNKTLYHLVHKAARGTSGACFYLSARYLLANIYSTSIIV